MLIKCFQNKEYLDAALKNAQFISEKQLQENGALYHNYKDGRSSINGYLEDYAAVIDAYIALYEVTLDEKWIDLAKELNTIFFYQLFLIRKNSMFLFYLKRRH